MIETMIFMYVRWNVMYTILGEGVLKALTICSFYHSREFGQRTAETNIKTGYIMSHISIANITFLIHLYLMIHIMWLK